MAGFGCRGQGTKLLKLASKLGAPIITTFRAKGVMDETEPLYVGCHGGVGSTAAGTLMNKADLLIAIGTSFSDLSQIPKKRTVQIDINPLMIARRYPVEVGLLGNSAVLIPKLTAKVQETNRVDYAVEVAQLKKAWQKQLEKEADATLKPIRPQYIMKVLSEKVAADAVISLDVGENCWWFGRNFQMKKTQKMVMSGHVSDYGLRLTWCSSRSVGVPQSSNHLRYR